MNRALKAAHEAGVGNWSERQYLNFLEEAVGALECEDPPLPFRLNGRELIHREGKTARLSKQEADFLQLLIDAEGNAVARKQFLEVSITHPTHVKNRLVKRLTEAGIEVEIVSSPNAYTLTLAR